ncbi:MAG: hypothetical protein ACRD3O_17080, partial [Terriglobia bacterium]
VRLRWLEEQRVGIFARTNDNLGETMVHVHAMVFGYSAGEVLVELPGQDDGKLVVSVAKSQELGAVAILRGGKLRGWARAAAGWGTA